jgi:hypothetical protein
METKLKKFSKNGFVVLLLDLIFVAAGVLLLVSALLQSNGKIKEIISSIFGK